MKIGEIWTIKSKYIEEARQSFIESGDEDDFGLDGDNRVRIIELYAESTGRERIKHKCLSVYGTIVGEYVSDFLEEYEKVYE